MWFVHTQGVVEPMVGSQTGVRQESISYVPTVDSCRIFLIRLEFINLDDNSISYTHKLMRQKLIHYNSFP